jgi:hypothetical protein
MDAESGPFTVGQISHVHVVDAGGRGLGAVQAVAFKRDGYATKVAVAEGDRLRFVPVEGARLEDGRLRLGLTITPELLGPETR